ncbi:Phytochrome-like protein cph2 [bacterium HR40]|nr:Phytochrome-like protein cph2 [bacterium HR40]
MAEVVVVDDRVTNRNILARLAQSVEEGVVVRTFASAREALQAMLAAPPPDLIVTDYSMPEMDGATFVTLVRSQPGFEDLPIIVVTVYEERDFCYRALEAGATDFLLSPVDHVEFRARVRNLLTLRRQQKMLAQRAAQLEEVLKQQPHPGFWGPQADLRLLLDSLPAAISVADEQGRLVYVNPAYAGLFATTPERLVGRLIGEAHGEDFATRHAVLNEKVMQSGRPLLLPNRELLENGQETHALLTVKTPLDCPTGLGRWVVSLSLDVSGLDFAQGERRRAHDPLTGLPGEEMIRERLAEELVRGRRHGRMVALHLLDLDRFKGIVEAFGDTFGDELLAAVARRLADRLRETDYLGRVRSDEFAMIQTGITRIDDAAELCRRVSEAFAEPFVVAGREVHLSASTGITLFPGDGRTVETLFRNAELALMRAKKGGRDTYRFFAAEMNTAARRAVALERELRQALAADQFLVHYQPKVDLHSGRVIGMEALLRWNHPHRGVVRPGEFIGLAEDIGLIVPLTHWVLQSACRQLREWLAMGARGLQLSVNLSPVHFRERGIEFMIERVLAESGVPPHLLELELVESAVIDNTRTAHASLRYLQKLGVQLAIDDFGTGYSSLSYLRRLPVHRLKIDQSFVHNLEKGSSDEVIVRAIIGLGHSLDLRVVAEGVETEAQLARLRELGCDEAQGDFVGPPMSAEEFEERCVRPLLAAAE